MYYFCVEVACRKLEEVQGFNENHLVINWPLLATMNG